MKEGNRTSKVLQDLEAGSRVIKLFICKHVIPFKEKNYSKGKASGPGGFSQALNPNRVCPARFQNCLETETSYFFPFYFHKILFITQEKNSNYSGKV